MKGAGKAAVLIAVVAAVVATVVLREARRPGPGAAATAPAAPGPADAAGVPRLLELGSRYCRTCVEMAKVLDELRASQGERLRVDFIDVYEQPAEAESRGIAAIPTQILYDSGGREIFRHTGYFAHDDILGKFRELGVAL